MSGFLLISNANIIEGDVGNKQIVFTVTLIGAAIYPVTVKYKTTDGTAKQPSDYIATTGTLEFKLGEASKTISVNVVGDVVPELTKIFYVNLYQATNAIVLAAIGVGIIIDNDAIVSPKLSITDIAMNRGLDGNRTMLFNISLNGRQKDMIHVVASTSNVTALANVDYKPQSQTITFLPGETLKQFPVIVYGTEKLVADKFFYVTLSDSTADIVKGTGIGILKYGK